MNKVIECICKLLPNKVYITVPSLEKGMLYVVTGVSNLDTDIPFVIVKKDEKGAKATYNVPYNLVEQIIVRDFGNDKDKNQICRS